MTDFARLPILSPTEVEELLESTEVARQGVPAESIDLLASDRFIQMMIPSLTVGYVRLAETLRKILTSLLRVKAEVHDETPEVLTGRGLMRVAEHAGCMLGLSTRVHGQVHGASILCIDRRLTSALIDRLFGGETESSSSDIDRPLTALERRVLQRALQPVVDALNETLEPRDTFHFETSCIECNLDLVKGFTPDVTVLHVPITMQLGERLASMSLALPGAVLEPIRGLFAANVEQTADASMMRDIVCRTPVQLEVELGRASIGLRKLSRLEVGQVLKLDRHPSEELPINISGMTKFHGLPVSDSGALAIEITRTSD